LLHCVAGLDDLTSGRAFIGDVDLSTLNDQKLTILRRDRVGFVFQAFNLLPTLSALDNGFLTGTGISGMLRALEQSWGRDPETMIPDVRFTPNPHDAPNGPLVERGE